MEHQKALTRHQQEIMNVIMEEVKSGQPFPTLRRINQLLGKENLQTTNGIRQTLEAMRKRGHLTRIGAKWTLSSTATREQLIAIVKNLVKWNDATGQSRDNAWIEAEQACRNCT